MSLGDDIGAEIAVVEKFLEPILASVPSPVTSGILVGLKLLAYAEPAAYNAVVAVVQSTPLTPEQTQAVADAMERLQDPEIYFE